MIMKKIVLLIGLLLASPAFAADDAVILTPGVGVGMKSKDVGGGKQAMQPVLSDGSGNILSFPTAGADAVSNTSLGMLAYSRMVFFNGTTWDRWQGAVTATLTAETTKVIGTVRVASGGVASGAFASGSIASGAYASGSIGSGAVASGAYASGSIASGAVAAGALASGAGVDGWDLTEGTTTQTACAAPTSATACTLIQIEKGILDAANQPGQLKVNSTGGATPTGNIAANNTTAVVIKASAGTLYGVQLAGLGSAPAYLKIYNATSATCGSGTPVKRLMIPAASTAALGAGSNVTFGPMGVAFGTGITYCITTGITDADTTAPAASTFLVNLDWN